MRSFYRPRKTILFFPERPPFASVELKLCALLGHAITTDPGRKFDVAFKRRDATFSNQAELRRIPVGLNKIVNGRSVDISKRTLGRAFANVFGYPLEVDPVRYQGDIVEKSDSNAKHDGRILTAPEISEEARPEFVYQRLIDNSSDGGNLVLDYRVPIYGEEIPLVYLKYRRIETRFSNENAFVKLEQPGVSFQPEELGNLLLLARKMGVDYGEFDVLRDTDGRIYVVDANNTPWGPPNGLPLTDSRIALARLAQCFDRFLNRWQVRSISSGG